MFNDPLDKQFSKSLLDAARAVNDKTVADAKSAKEDKEQLVTSDEDMIGQFDEARSFLKGPQKKYHDPFRPGTALHQALKDVEALGARQRAAREAQTPADAKAKLAAAKELAAKRQTNSFDHDTDKTQLDEVEMFKRVWDDPTSAKHKMAKAYGKSRTETYFGKSILEHPTGMKYADHYSTLALAADHALSNVHGTHALRKTTRDMHKALNGNPGHGEIYHAPSMQDIDHAIRHVAQARTDNILGKPKIQEMFGWGKKKKGPPKLSNNQFKRHEQKRYFNLGADHAEAGSPRMAPSTLHPDIRAHYDHGYDTVMSNKKR